MDEGIAVARDWALVSPGSRSFFANFLVNELGENPLSDFMAGSLNDAPFLEMVTNQRGSGDSVAGGGRRSEAGTGSGCSRFDLGIGKEGSRGGLVERMAARTGFVAPKLNVARAKLAPAGSLASPVLSPSAFLTIPPGLSPAALLDSPIFLLNSVIQPSPTTGKLHPGQISASNLSKVPEVDAAKLFDDLGDTDLFAMKPSLGLNISYFQNAVDKQISLDQKVSIQLEHRQHVDNVSMCDALSGNEEQRKEISSNSHGQSPDDGYNWRKYGQKQVKGSERPRGCYRCTQPDCPAKKKIERSQEGDIIDVIYKGTHNHLKPPPSRQMVLLPSQEQGGGGVEDQAQFTGMEVWPMLIKSEDGTEASSHIPQAQVGHSFESRGSPDDSEVEQVNQVSELVEDNMEDSESNSKRRKLDTSLLDTHSVSRNSHEPRIVVQTTSDVDVLDDGYRWRKYGQKVVKGNPNPRSYYKCTSAGCIVRKHVERAPHDLKAVITTYEGRHNHDVPVPRTSGGQGATAPSSIQQPQSSIRMSETYQVRDGFPLYNAQVTSYGAFRPPEGSQGDRRGGGLCLGVGQVAIGSNAAMSEIGAAMGVRMVVPQMQMDLGLQRARQAGLPTLEQVAGARVRLPNAVYQQIVRKQPFGS